MIEALISPEHIHVVEEARAFARAVPSSLLRRMDAEEVRYPREFVADLGEAGLLGLRFGPEWGGRGMPWTVECAVIEEIGVLGTAMSCLYSLPSIVGEAIHTFGTDLDRLQRNHEPPDPARVVQGGHGGRQGSRHRG
ncbi:MAG: acyl-CoA dehydrogenase family protein [Thermoanaerobaculales bacterium]|nr:acyl-CoA dehydrogenase family protein [Thermoanaerobaculales bacterium]